MLRMVVEIPSLFVFLMSYISNRALELENRIEDKLEPKLDMFGMILYYITVLSHTQTLTYTHM